MSSIGGANEELFSALTDAARETIRNVSDNRVDAVNTLLDSARTCLWEAFKDILFVG
jgi:hypothetical protein